SCVAFLISPPFGYVPFAPALHRMLQVCKPRMQPRDALMAVADANLGPACGPCRIRCTGGKANACCLLSELRRQPICATVHAGSPAAFGTGPTKSPIEGL